MMMMLRSHRKSDARTRTRACIAFVFSSEGGMEKYQIGGELPEEAQ